MRRSAFPTSRRGFVLGIGTIPAVALTGRRGRAANRQRVAQPGGLDQLWICTDIDCSPHIYDPREGDPDAGIPPGTPMEAIPDDWICPECGAPKSAFIPYRRRA